MTAYLRLLHASPGAPAVDVYANGLKIASNLDYREFTPYLALPTGSYNIQVFPAGRRTNPVLTSNLTVPPNSIQTVAVIDQLPHLRLLPMPEPRMERRPNLVHLRFAQLSPNAPAIDLRLSHGATLFRNIHFGQVTPYISLHPGTYTLDLYRAGTNERLLHVPNVHLHGNRFYTVDAIGLVGGRPPLEVLIPLDGNSYLTS
ncbi:DUF4397 domain-containing protein [Rubeoparvulum massiliense]|uniref:DUF4397 domain-containing protein n=1 Tax=Rubeoparvulum massiliense TaxID=1631346 RepID=UPI00065E3F92|nr:DUF4397 domain-containing protein [Rubeoparvulum massiliense]